MKKYFTLYIIAFILCLISSCSKDDDFKGGSPDSKPAHKDLRGGTDYYWLGIDFPRPDFPIQQRPDLLWGVNGHPTRWANQYDLFTEEEQVEYLKELGVNIYRFEGSIDLNGKLLCSSYGDDHGIFLNLLDVLQQNEMEALPVIFTFDWQNDLHLGSNWNYNHIRNYINAKSIKGVSVIKNLDIWKHYYQRGETMGEKYVLNYGGIKYYNIGNETTQHIARDYVHSENDLNNDGIPDQGSNLNFFYNNYGGQDMTHFFTCEEYAKRIIANVACYAGIINGIKSVVPNAKCVITENRVNFGYLEFLKYMGVNYDIVGYNFYGENFKNYNADDDQPPYDLYSDLINVGDNKPIWITEVNKSEGSYQDTEEQQFVAMRNYIIQLYKLENIKAIIEYELIDREGFSSSIGPEDYYGLIRSPQYYNNTNNKKPAFNTLRYTIEELKYGYDDFFYFYYKKYANRETDLLNAHLPNNPIGYWSNIVKNGNGSNLGQCLDYMIKVDCRNFIEETFLNLLGVENVGEEAFNHYWSSINNDNLPFEAIIADIVSSDQFYNHAQSSKNPYLTPYPAENFIRYAFFKLTEGTYLPSNAEVLQIYNSYQNLSNNRAQRRTIARNVIMELEAYKIRVLINQFKNLLDKSNPQPQDQGIQWHLNNYTDQKSKIKEHLMSREFWHHSIITGYLYRQGAL